MAVPEAAPSAAAGPFVLGRVQGAPITTADLPDPVKTQLLDIDNEMQQRRFHLEWAGLEEVVEQRVFAAEAARQGVTVEELRQREVLDKVIPATDNDAKAFFDKHADRIGVPYEMAAPHIKRQLSEQREEELQQALIAKLREGVPVEYSLRAPNLPRFPMSDGGAPALGPPNAKVTIVEFSDFQCPFCSEARHVVKRLVDLYPEQVRLVYRDFPLSQHERARPAAEAAQCANEQGKFWPYHDLLFDNANALSEEDLQRYAGTVGLDAAAFKACRASERPKTEVQRHEQDAQRYGVEGTPAIFVNGMKLIGLLPLPLMRALIDRELQEGQRP